MSGHSHWHNIQLKKGKSDAKRAGIFSKLVKNITVAAREGGDPTFNFKLRMAVDAAKAVSVPKDNIDRAIQRGTGEGDGGAIEEVIYEGFAPGGVAVLVVCLTDNRNRTVSEVKLAASKAGGTIGASGSVMWMFEKKGVVTIEDALALKDRDAFDLAVIDAGAEDISIQDGVMQVVCEVRDLQKTLDAAKAAGNFPTDFSPVSIEYIAKQTVAVTDPAVKQRLDAFVEAMEDLDDVDAVYTNEA